MASLIACRIVAKPSGVSFCGRRLRRTSERRASDVGRRASDTASSAAPVAGARVTRLPRPCLARGCPVTVMPPAGRCARHMTDRDRQNLEAERERERRRAGRRPQERASLYDASWRAHSAARRAGSDGCERCGGTTAGLTVDHPTDAVLCRPCHGRLEAARRRYLHR